MSEPTARRVASATRDSLTPSALRILEVASELLYQNGIHATGVDAIAAASGVTKRTLYDRFGSKEQLVAAYLRSRHERWWAYLQDQLTAADGSRVLALFDAYAGDGGHPTDRGCAFLNAAAELAPQHEGYAVIQQHKTELKRQLATLVLQDHPALPDPHKVVDHLYLLLEGAIAHRGIDGGPHLLHRAADIAQDLLQPQPATPPAGPK